MVICVISKMMDIVVVIVVVVVMYVVVMLVVPWVWEGPLCVLTVAHLLVQGLVSSPLVIHHQIHPHHPPSHLRLVARFKAEVS